MARMLALSGAPDEMGFWPILLAALAVGLALARVRTRYSETVIAARRVSRSPVGEVPPRTKTLSTKGTSLIRSAILWVVASVSSSREPGGSSTEIETRLTSSGGMKLPGT